MKKLSMLLIVLLAFASCSKVDTTNPGLETDQSAGNVPQLFGTMLPEDQTPATRGVADNTKVWNKPMAKTLTVKFLSGSPDEYVAFVKETVIEWEEVANVKFNFVESNKNAIVRIGFDKVRYMNASWAMTGMDHLKEPDQAKPTVHYANWANLSETRKRSDVLRTFGQVLGLELEFRHPDFNPGWLRTSTGSIDEEEIKLYWQSQLASSITWTDLKKIVLDPLSFQTENISKTKEYDPNSIMTWRLPQYIAKNIPVSEYVAPVSELSKQDKEFIQELYGTPVSTTTDVVFPLIEFEYTGTAPQFIVKTTKKLVVQWDSAINKEYTVYDIPAGATTPQTITIKNTFTTAKTRKIVIGELIPVGQPLPATSFVLTLFDFQDASSAKNFNIMNLNKALTCVRIVGVQEPSTQTFDFTDNATIKELYLVKIANSKVILKNCANIETFSTSVSLEQFKKQLGYNDGSLIGSTIASSKWPTYPETTYSLANSCLTINNCYNLKYLGLEHTRITDFNFSGMPNLEFVYLSSFANYVVGGGSAEYAYLTELVSTLSSRVERTRGSIAVQNVVAGDTTNPYKFTPAKYNSTIQNLLSAKNWDFFSVGAGIDMNLVDDGEGYYKLYYRYLNPKYVDLQYACHINRYIGESSDLVVWRPAEHNKDAQGRPYYRVYCPASGNLYFRVGLKVGNGPNGLFDNNFLSYKEVYIRDTANQ